MELLDNYNKACDALTAHLKFNLKGEWAIIDCSMFYWHLIEEGVAYARDGKDVEKDPFIMRLASHKFYETRVFGGKELTALITGAPGNEALQIFDNKKYIGDKDKEREYL